MDHDQEVLLTKELRDLQIVLTEVKKYWKKQSSLRWNFLRGIIYGFGFFIGSALLVAAVAYVLSHIPASSDNSFGRFLQDLAEIFKKSR